jgi:lipid-A-disaccharide synthase-like uncharacterized protein
MLSTKWNSLYCRSGRCTQILLSSNCWESIFSKAVKPTMNITREVCRLHWTLRHPYLCEGYKTESMCLAEQPRDYVPCMVYEVSIIRLHMAQLFWLLTSYLSHTVWTPAAVIIDCTERKERANWDRIPSLFWATALLGSLQKPQVLDMSYWSQNTDDTASRPIVSLYPCILTNMFNWTMNGKEYLPCWKTFIICPLYNGNANWGARWL